MIEERMETEAVVVEKIARLSREEVDALPYGLMIFDSVGDVHLYNRYEAELARRTPEEVVGRNWFRDVAPCTRVAAFEGRFRAFVERADPTEMLRFEFRFHFLHGAQDVFVSFAHAPEPDRVFVIVTRRALDERGRRLDVIEPVVTHVDKGRARGGLGSALPAPRVFWATAFDALEDEGCRSALERGGRAWGRALLEGIEASAEAVHGAPLTALPTLLAVSLIDESFAAQGLGRLEVDFGGHAHGVLGFAVRPADLPGALADVLYPALLAELACGLVGRPLSVVRLGAHGEIVRFAVTTREKAETIRRLRTDGVPLRELLSRTGLETWS